MLEKDWASGKIACSLCPLWSGTTDAHAATHLRLVHPERYALLTGTSVERNN